MKNEKRLCLDCDIDMVLITIEPDKYGTVKEVEPYWKCLNCGAIEMEVENGLY